jgi:predicted AlkP superfamily pyrophosphatase or phosphodiesterase
VYLAPEDAEQILSDVKWLDREKIFLMPDYSNSIANVPWTILENLSGKKNEHSLKSFELDRAPEKVILVLIDGCGYAQWKNSQSKFKQEIEQKGKLKGITSVFPSTTAAALTSFSTGLTPLQHGLIEWYIYLEEIQEIVASLPFTPIGVKGRDTLSNRISARVLFRGKPLFQIFNKEGIKCISFLSRQIASGEYTRFAQRGSRIVPYSSSSDLFVSLRKNLTESKQRSFFYVYWSMVDSIEHSYGPSFEGSSFELELFLYSFRNFFLSKLSKEDANNVLVLITADHGQIDVDPAKTIYLNRFRKLVKSFRKQRNGKPILPSGSARDVFLFVENRDEILEYLEKKLQDVAFVISSDKAQKLGLFGKGKPSKRFKGRVGDIMILPYFNNTTWFKFENLNELDLRGHHGGLTTDEMIIPLIHFYLSDFLD